MKILQIAGRKKSGKTTTTIDFIKAARELDLKVATFKHSHHCVAMDVEGTDTARFSEAGSQQVALSNDSGFFWHEIRKPKTIEEEIRDFVAPDTDIVFTESFNDEGLPKLLLVRPEDDTESLDKFKPADYIASIYQESNFSDKIDLSTEDLRKAWIKAWLAEV